MRLKLGQPEVALLMYDFVSKAPSANLKELSMASNKQAIALSQLQQRSQRVGLEEQAWNSNTARNMKSADACMMQSVKFVLSVSYEPTWKRSKLPGVHEEEVYRSYT
eukprot:CAMPEP_0182833480 /NCGR_PEP_ID=MMETSP0006_2-20121128/20317_1 /TAXON_ID=97485 /ORGANISM="Prymnesium parvum, Strain Texoma1" /LENGTH=106 /DNA_ID=CAMNT_0024961489 /DNA_START=94 /DNA_END=415 /DNA_ORIENTATION=+